MEINIYLKTIQRGWWIIVMVMFTAMNVSLLVSYFTPPVYETSSRFVVSPNAEVYTNSWDIVDSLDTLDRRSIINTYKELLTSSAAYTSSPEIQKLDPVLLEDQYAISVVVVPDTNILKLSVEGPDPDIVVQISNAIGTEALDYVNRLYPVYNFSVLEKPKIPTTPIRPEPVKNAGLALLIGAVLGVGLAFSREQLQFSFERLRERTITDPVTTAYTHNHFEKRLREEVVNNPDANFAFGIINFRGIEESIEVLPSAMIDRAMRKVAQVLKSELRGRDMVGRWEVSQLSVLLASSSSSAVETTFKRIQSYLSEPIQLNDTGDIIIRPDPCIGVVSHNPFESSDDVIERGKSAMEQASSYESPAVIYLSTPFVYDDESGKI